MAPTRVVIVDDVSRVREDLRTVLTLGGDIEIVGEAANGLEAVRHVRALRPDVVLMDLQMPVLDGFDAARQIKAICPSCRVIALTVHDYEEAWHRASQAGMDGFMVKGAPVATLMQAVLGRSE